MRAIEKYIDALKRCDNKGLADIFAEDGSLRDYCPNSTGRQEYHIYGREAIDMFFKNKFSFRQYQIFDAEVVNDWQAEFVASIGGYYVMAIATVRRVDENGLITRLTVRPK
ncbi:MAG: nuclear transport factor 2 family protein [Lachnospiraceae bacterium]